MTQPEQYPQSPFEQIPSYTGSSLAAKVAAGCAVFLTVLITGVATYHETHNTIDQPHEQTGVDAEQLGQ